MTSMTHADHIVSCLVQTRMAHSSYDYMFAKPALRFLLEDYMQPSARAWLQFRPAEDPRVSVSALLDTPTSEPQRGTGKPFTMPHDDTCNASRLLAGPIDAVKVKPADCFPQAWSICATSPTRKTIPLSSTSKLRCWSSLTIRRKVRVRDVAAAAGFGQVLTQSQRTAAGSKGRHCKDAGVPLRP